MSSEGERSKPSREASESSVPRRPLGPSAPDLIDERCRSQADAEGQPLAARHPAQKPDDDYGCKPGDHATKRVLKTSRIVRTMRLTEAPGRERAAQIQRQCRRRWR